MKKHLQVLLLLFLLFLFVGKLKHCLLICETRLRLRLRRVGTCNDLEANAQL